MIAKVIRSGKHSDGDFFAEVREKPTSPPYTVPVSELLPIGTEVTITIEVTKTAKEVATKEK